MRIYDISVPISADLHLYAGDPPVLLEPWTQLAAADLAAVSRLSLGTHTGTHVDAPSHFLPGGGSLDAIDLDACIGAAIVLDLSALPIERIDAASLRERLPPATQRLLLKTRNSALWRAEAAQTDFVALSLEAAVWLAEQRLRLVGIDYLSVAPFDDPAPVHRALLSAGVLILEGLDLSGVPAGSYQLLCLPLRVAGADGAPARAILVRES